MEIKIRVPLSLHKITGNNTEFVSHGNTIEELFNNLDRKYPGIKGILWDQEGKINNPFSLFVNGRSVKFLNKEKILLKNGDEIIILQLVAGG